MSLMIGMFLCSVPALKDGKGKVMGKGKGKGEAMTIFLRSPNDDRIPMPAYGSDTLENVRERLPIDPKLGPYMKRDVVLSKQIPLSLTLDALNIQHGDTLFVSGANGLCCEKLFAPSPGIFRLV
jgi:DNA-binding beta-propeller fold protein YncE